MSPSLALSRLPTNPANNLIAFFTGEEDQKLTRSYGKWLNQDSIMIKGSRYISIYTLEGYFFSPWNQTELINGTDGLQFEPNVTQDQTLQVFCENLSRNC